MFHGMKMCSLSISRRESLHRLNNHGVEEWKRVKNSRMEWTGVEFEIHAVKTLIHALWPWKKFMVFSEIHKPPFRMKSHKYCLYCIEVHYIKVHYNKNCSLYGLSPQ